MFSEILTVYCENFIQRQLMLIVLNLRIMECYEQVEHSVVTTVHEGVNGKTGSQHT